jgi:hypothetical protein
MSDCDHKWVHLESIKKEDGISYTYCTSLKKVDRFFCEKCLEQKEVVKECEVSRHSKYPDWW